MARVVVKEGKYYHDDCIDEKDLDTVETASLDADDMCEECEEPLLEGPDTDDRDEADDDDDADEEVKK